MLPLVHAAHALIMNAMGFITQFYNNSSSSAAVLALTLTSSTTTGICYILERVVTTFDAIPKHVTAAYAHVSTSTNSTLHQRPPAINHPGPGPRSQTFSQDMHSVFRLLVEMVYAQNEYQRSVMERQERRHSELMGQISLSIWTLTFIAVLGLVFFTFTSLYRVIKRSTPIQTSPQQNLIPANTQPYYRRRNQRVQANDRNRDTATNGTRARAAEPEGSRLYVPPGRRRASATQ